MQREFYYLELTLADQFYRAEEVSDVPRQYRQSFMRGFEGTLTIRIAKGGRPGDFLPCSLLYIVSDRVLKLMREESFTGYRLYRVEVLGGKGDIPTYHGLAIHGRGGPFDPGKCEIRYSPPDENGRRTIDGMRGIAFYEDQWDGSDLFYLGENSGHCIVTERVKTAFKKAKVTNCTFIPIEEFSFGLIS